MQEFERTQAELQAAKAQIHSLNDLLKEANEDKESAQSAHEAAKREQGQASSDARMIAAEKERLQRANEQVCIRGGG